MTSGRLPLLLLPCVLGGVLAVNGSGCGAGGSAGCTQCPDVRGRYALEVGEGTDSAGCASLPATLPVGPLELAQEGSTLTAALDGVTLRGTLYQTYDFTLLGVGDAASDGGTRLDSMGLSGRYVPALGDGGVPRLSGTWQADVSRSAATGAQRCSATRSLTATRQ